LINRGIEGIAFEVESYLPSVNTLKELEIAIEILKSDAEQKSIHQTIFDLKSNNS